MEIKRRVFPFRAFRVFRGKRSFRSSQLSRESTVELPPADGSFLYPECIRFTSVFRWTFVVEPE